MLDVVRAISTSIAAIAAVVGVWRYFREQNAARRLRWQKTTVQAIMQTSARVNFEQLKLCYRSNAADHMKSKLGASDITDEALRMILIDLCRDNVVVQFGSDEYTLTTYLGKMEEMKEQNSRLLELQQVFFQAQLEFLSKQDESIREMVEHQKAVTRSLVPGFGNANLREIK